MRVVTLFFKVKHLFLFILITLSNIVQANDWTGIKECGIYKVSGVIHLFPKKGLKIVVNEHTKSEIIISVPINNEPSLAPFIDKPIEASVYFNKKNISPEFNGIIKNVKSRYPNPLNPSDTGVSLLSKGECRDE